MFSKFKRSWMLVKYTVSLLKQDKKLLIFPLLSSIAAVLVLFSFVPLMPESFETVAESETISSEGELVWLFFLYVAEYFVVFFFNSALVATVLDKLNGRPASIGSGLHHAFARFVPILGYAVIAATVGVILRAISERVGFIGQIVIGLMGAAWSIGCFLVVPVLVSRDVGPVDAIKESMGMLKRTWGENITANAGLGLVFFGIYLLTLGLMFAIGASGLVNDGQSMLVLIGLCVLAFLLIGLVHATLQGIYSAVLYFYAAHANDNPGSDNPNQGPNLLSEAFAPK